MADPIAINSLILTQLAGGEMGLLRLIVAVRKSLGRFEKGDLSEIVKSALRKLVLSQAVVEVDGIYSLGPRTMGHRPSRGAAGAGTE
jgi:hypothetical protein